MFNSFKYLELTRHHIYTKTKKMINDYAKMKVVDLINCQR